MDDRGGASATRQFDERSSLEAYGIRNALTTPLRERNIPMLTDSLTGRQLIERKQQSCVVRTASARMTIPAMGSKENADMSFEINVPTGTDVQVQIEVEDGDGNVISRSPLKRIALDTNETSSKATSVRFQRMGAITTESYSVQSTETHSAVATAITAAKRNESGKHLSWHESVMDAVELSERRRRESQRSETTTTREMSIRKAGNSTASAAASDSAAVVMKGLVAGRAAIFERQMAFDDNVETAERQVKDPAELPLADRLALFERNKGTALMPKAALAMSPSAKQIANTSVSSANSRQCLESRIANNSQNNHHQDKSILLSLLDCSEISELNDTKWQPPIVPKTKIDDLRTDADQSGHSDDCLNVSNGVREAIKNQKSVEAMPPATGYIYPSLQDAHSVVESDTKPEKSESSDSDRKSEDNDDLLFSSRLRIEEDGDEHDAHSASGSEMHSPNNDYSAMNEYMDEALESCDDGDEGDDNDCDSDDSDGDDDADDDDVDADDDDDDDDSDVEDYNQNQQGESASMSSKSFSFKKERLEALRQQAVKELASFPSPSNRSDARDSEELAHTLDSYRHQQSRIAAPMLSEVGRDHAIDFASSSNSGASDDDDPDDDHVRSQAEGVQAKIKRLLEIADIEQQQMVQASNALNTCASTFAFLGSAESVVAEWKLLIATHSRQAAQAEVARLRSDRFLRAANAQTECGSLIVRDITLPLQQEFVTKFQNEKTPGQHLVCLLKYNEQVVATKTVLTQPTSYSARFHDILKLNNVFADFRIVLEVFGMNAQHEVLPHDVKYGINKKKGLLRTPIGKKASPIAPPKPQPLGPNAVHTPSFVRYGHVTFSLRDAHRTNWTLDLMPGVSNPLFGTVHMKMNYEFAVNIDHRGFLTMFEDISGLGAWHRRWCRLHSTCSGTVLLSYWKYPDDERKPPIGSLDLNACEQKIVASAPREVCARLNTMLLELKRSKHDGDQDSLLLVVKDDHTIVRHLLAADTKEERNEWIAYFTKALALMRGWNGQR